MARKKSPSGHVVRNAVHSEKKSVAATDLSKLNEILVKSPQWKKNAMQGIEERRAAEGLVDTDALQLKASLLDLIERHWLELAGRSNVRVRQSQDIDFGDSSAVNDEVASPNALKLTAELEERNREIARLLERIGKLEAQNRKLREQHQREVDGRKNEVQLLRAAFSQFQRESDQLLSELDQENANLRSDRHP